MLAALEHAPTGVAVIAADGRFLHVNRAFAALLARPAGELLALRWQDVVRPDAVASCEAALAGGPAELALPVLRPGGAAAWLSWTARALDAGPARLVVHVQDAGDHGRLAALVRAAPDAIVTQDRDGLVTSWNPSAEQIFGYSAAAALGRPYAQLVVPREERTAFASRAAQVRSGRTLTVRTRRLRADGSVFPALVSAAPVGDYAGTLEIVRDVTDMLETERELHDRAEQLEHSNADLERFAYAASHELQEPLRSIKLAAATVLGSAGQCLDADERSLLEHIDTTSARMSAQVDALMQVSQVALDSSPDAAPLAAALDDALEALRAAAGDAGARIDVEAPLPPVAVPRAEIALVLQNLIGNAIKYRRPGIAPRITVSGSEAAGHVEVRVADNGLGLSEGERSRIFGIFERGASGGVAGTGMGLAVVRRIVERRGGSVSAFSAGPGTGSEFALRLPS